MSEPSRLVKDSALTKAASAAIDNAAFKSSAGGHAFAVSLALRTSPLSTVSRVSSPHLGRPPNHEKYFQLQFATRSYAAAAPSLSA